MLHYPRFMKHYLIILVVAICGASCKTTQQAAPIDPYNYSINKQVLARNGAVVSAHPLATDAGLQMLIRGGNAVDAAIATQLALAVVYPGAGNLGGGGFMVAHLSTGKTIALDYRETAPAKAHRDMYLDSAGKALGHLSLNGHLAAGVPGTVAGLYASLPYAKLSMKQLIEPAIQLAEKGFAVTESQAQSFNNTKDEFIKYNTTRPAFVKDIAWKAGDTLKQPELAATLKRIKEDGLAGFYEGETARLIVAEMSRGNGIITLEDLKNYKAVEREVLNFGYNGFTILSMPLPSSGGIILAQTLNMIDSFNLNRFGFQSAEAMQVMIEAERRAYADRAEFLGDPDFVKVPVKKLISKEYARDRMKDFKPGVAGNSDITKPGIIKESDETTHLSVIDKWGNAVAVTTTLNNSYGSKTVVGGAGFLLNDEMDDFSIKPGEPNLYGAIGNEKNAIAPNKRMLSSMTPTIVLKNEKPFLVLGTPGGTTIPTSVFQTILNITEFEMPVAEAVNKPKFHHQWLPDLIMIEPGINAETLEKLKAMGYKFREVSQIGRTEVIRIDPIPGGNKITAVGDRRGDDAAGGY